MSGWTVNKPAHAHAFDLCKDIYAWNWTEVQNQDFFSLCLNNLLLTLSEALQIRHRKVDRSILGEYDYIPRGVVWEVLPLLLLRAVYRPFTLATRTAHILGTWSNSKRVLGSRTSLWYLECATLSGRRFVFLLMMIAHFRPDWSVSLIVLLSVTQLG